MGKRENLLKPTTCDMTANTSIDSHLNGTKCGGIWGDRCVHREPNVTKRRLETSGPEHPHEEIVFMVQMLGRYTINLPYVQAVETETEAYGETNIGRNSRVFGRAPTHLTLAGDGR